MLPLSVESGLSLRVNLNNAPAPPSSFPGMVDLENECRWGTYPLHSAPIHSNLDSASPFLPAILSLPRIPAAPFSRSPVQQGFIQERDWAW